MGRIHYMKEEQNMKNQKQQKMFQHSWKETSSTKNRDDFYENIGCIMKVHWLETF